MKIISIFTLAHFVLLLFWLTFTKIEAAGDSQQTKAFYPLGPSSSSSSHLSSSSSHIPSAALVTCAKHKVVIPLRYKSDENSELIDLLVSDQQIKAGGNGQFFVGFTGTKHRLDSLPREKCVAIKKMASAKKAEHCNAIRVLKWVQRHIESTKRRHIAKLFDAGYDKSTDSFIMVSELGDETLKERLYAENRDFLIAEMVKKITVPLLELHRAAMHLDIKPSNYVFVKSEDDALKLIDFDGAELLVENAWSNQCKIPQANAHTMRYMSPEQDEHIFKKRKALSVKADIWAIGIITFEIILNNRYYELIRKQNDLDIDLVLHYIAEYYRAYQILKNDKQMVKFNHLNLNSEEWLEKSNYKDTLAHIMRIAADYPLLFHLIINTLSIDPEKRMTARGIVDYLDKKCVPMTSEQIVNVSSLPFFHNVTVGRMRRTFEERKDQKMLSLLSIVENEQRKAMNELKMRELTCETKNILMGEEEKQNLEQNNETILGKMMEKWQNWEKEEEGKKPINKIKQLFSAKSPKNDYWAIAKTKFGQLSKYAREEGDKPFMG